jgi:hypothetical protein
MITEAADVHGAHASSITGTEGFYRQEVNALYFGAFISVLLTHNLPSIQRPSRRHILCSIRYVGGRGVPVLFCLARVRSLNSSFRRSVAHSQPLHSPVRSGAPSVNSPAGERTYVEERFNSVHPACMRHVRRHPTFNRSDSQR